MEEKSFVIRTYKKSDLAHLYNPDMPIVSATRKLRLWIETNKDLAEKLKETHASKHDHHYTPRQVELIVRYLGEP